MTDTDNMTLYALTCNVIRDFCADAISCGRLPTDIEIDSLAGKYAIGKKAEEFDELP